MEKDYPIEKKLKDGTRVSIRPMGASDEELSLEFFRSIPAEERQYLRIDVTTRENVRRRMNPGPFQRCWRLVAEHEGRVCADGTLCGSMTGWMRHLSEIRCIVHPDFQRKGLGSTMIWELYRKAIQDNVAIVFCEIVAEQQAAAAALKRHGFERVLVRRNHVKAVDGKLHDLHVYARDVNEMWDTLKSYMMDLDFPRQ